MSGRPVFLLIGANGQVGQELAACFQPFGRVVMATRSGRLPSGAACERFDYARSEESIEIVRRIDPDLVLNAAAYTAVDRAEDEPESARAANALGPGMLAAACADQGSHLIHFSTDYVFDGTGTQPRGEDEPTRPLSTYGATKLEGERLVRASGCRYWIFRTSWVYGSRGHNFLLTMLKLANQRKDLRIVEDQIGAPTPARLIANAVLGCWIRGGHDSGTWHLACTGETSWKGFASAIFEGAHAAGLTEAIPDLKGIPTADYPTKATRPLNSRLSCARLLTDFGIQLPDWKIALDLVLGDLSASRSSLA